MPQLPIYPTDNNDSGPKIGAHKNAYFPIGGYVIYKQLKLMTRIISCVTHHYDSLSL